MTHSIAFAALLSLGSINVSYAAEFYIATPMSEGKRLPGKLYDNPLGPALCSMQQVDVLLKRGAYVKIDPNTGRPEPCSKGIIGELSNGTKVREITPPGPCSNEKNDYRRVRVLTGEQKDKVGCVYEGILASEPIP